MGKIEEDGQKTGKSKLLLNDLFKWYSDLVILEDLKTKGMTVSAKAPPLGKMMKQKAGLNHSILGTGWGKLDAFLSERGFVIKFNTSKTYGRCQYADPGNRKTQSRFLCLSHHYEIHADMNASGIYGGRRGCPGENKTYVESIRRPVHIEHA